MFTRQTVERVSRNTTSPHSSAPAIAGGKHRRATRKPQRAKLEISAIDLICIMRMMLAQELGDATLPRSSWDLRNRQPLKRARRRS